MKPIPGYEQYYHGKENLQTAQRLLGGEICVVVGFGQSMTPILKSGQPVLVEPIDPETEIRKNDIVMCKVRGHYYLHLVWAKKGEDSYLIGNNHGHANGTISRRNIFGVVVKIL